MQVTEHKRLKDQLGIAQITLLASAIMVVWPEFASQQFIRKAAQDLLQLELKQRVEHLIVVLAEYLPADYQQTVDILIQTGAQLKQDESTTGWSQFIAWPLIDYVKQYGQHDLHRSMVVLQALTPLFTAEFAIRPFIKNQLQHVYPYLEKWAQSEDEHLRRLASEALRPRLPWASFLKAFQLDPAPIFPILEQLKDDDSLYVRKSVANNLNDISKDHPKQVLALCRSWQQQATPQRQWIIKRALRTLIKHGYPQVFSLLGFTAKPQLAVTQFHTDKYKLKPGGSVSLELILRSDSAQDQLFVLDYRIHYVLGTGRYSSKVYKWKEIGLAPMQVLQLNKRHDFKPLTTRKFYPGVHRIELLVNGKVLAQSEITLIL